MVDDVIAERYRRAGWWTGRRLVDRFEAHVAEAPGALALVSGSDTLPRSELWLLAGQAAAQIRDVVGPGRRVVVIQIAQLHGLGRHVPGRIEGGPRSGHAPGHHA